MREEHRTSVNEFFVHVFNKILLFEEQSLNRSGCKDLSVREMHVLEAVDILEPEQCNSMSHIAERLAISVSALTTSVNALVRKEYLCRENSQVDRRIVYVKLTEKGQQALQYHKQFHERMIDSLDQQLSDEEWDTLIHSLDALSTFFNAVGSKKTIH